MSQDQNLDRMASILISIVSQSHVGKSGKPAMRSSYCNYPARLYQEARDAISAYAAEVSVEDEE